MKKIMSVALAATMLSGCASVTSVSLNYKDGKLVKDDDAPEGFIYYSPAPYLLVTELPVPPQGSGATTVNETKTEGSALVGAAPSTSKSTTNAGDTGQSQTAGPSSSGSDTSFSATMTSYSIKLIYLPDFDHPRALRLKSGILGTVSAAPTFQDGWMLTSLNGTSDSGVATTLTAIAGLVGGSAGGASKASGASTSGASAGLLAAMQGLSDDAKQKVQDALKKASNANLTSWGPYVLRPGLYRLGSVASAGISAVNPVAYFCISGVRVGSYKGNKLIAPTECPVDKAVPH